MQVAGAPSAGMDGELSTGKGSALAAGLFDEFCCPKFCSLWLRCAFLFSQHCTVFFRVTLKPGTSGATSPSRRDARSMSFAQIWAASASHSCRKSTRRSYRASFSASEVSCEVFRVSCEIRLITEILASWRSGASVDGVNAAKDPISCKEGVRRENKSRGEIHY